MERQTKSKDSKDPSSKNKGDQPHQEKSNSIFITRELIYGDPANYPKRLLQFKNIKNQNYQKFSERIYENLSKSNFSFSKSYQTFSEISRSAEDQNTTGHQMSCILQGFFRYWKKCDIELNSMQQFFKFINEVYQHVAKKYIWICKELIYSHIKEDFNYFRDEAMKLVGKYYRATKLQEDKILPLVHDFDLYDTFSNSKIVEIALRYSNANDIAFIFKAFQDGVRYDLVKLYIDKCVNRESKEDLKRCQTIIKILKLDPYQYQNMIEKMISRYINYQLRSNKLYFVELAVCYDIQLVEALVRQLIKEHRLREAKYFIVHYKLQNKYFNEISQKQRESIQKIRNILIDKDYFGPTEIEVLEEPAQQKNILYMKNLGFDESDVTFVDQSNIREINIQQAFSSKVIGIDSETTGGVHVFDQPQITILQIFTGKHIYIFDYLNLYEHPYLKEIITYIYLHCNIYGQDHQKEITAIQKQLDLDIDQKIMQELQRNRLLDTSKFFKKVFPKETKSSLVYITEFLLNIKVSKYEQCSGWRNRPLRKAQLHYASIDCVLPLILGEKLEQIQNSKKK